MVNCNDLAMTLDGRIGDAKGDIMYHWVEDKEFLKRSYSFCADIVNQLVQNLKHYGIYASMNVVGSKKRNMITQNENEDIDFDFNLLIENADDFRDAKALKHDIQTAFNEVLSDNDLEDCEDSTSALTTKPIHFFKGNKTYFSIDVCIVKLDRYGQLHRLIHQKTGIVAWDQWYWNQVPNSQELWKKEEALKPDYWQYVRQAYIDHKNMYLQRNDYNHPSFICYIEAVNEVYDKVRRGTIGLHN